MSWAKLDDKANEHVKQLRAGSEACWFWACGLMYANRQEERDGFVPDEALSILYGPARNPKKLAATLVRVGLWELSNGGFRIHNYHQWNPTHEQIAEERAKGRTRAALSYARRHGGSSPEEKPKTLASSVEDETKKPDSSGSTRVDPLRLHSDSTPDLSVAVDPKDLSASAGVEAGGRVPCPSVDEILNSRQCETLSMNIPDWAVRILVAKFVAKNQATSSDLRTPEHWSKCCVSAIQGDWNNPRTRPSNPEADPTREVCPL